MALQLYPFISNFPPSDSVRPASPEKVAAWRGVIPQSLLEVWALYGFGFYGAEQLCLLDPDEWKDILDRWVVTSGRKGMRAPLLMSPFGDLFYYRRLTETDEDISVIFTDTSEVQVLSWDLAKFFNGMLCDRRLLQRGLFPAQLERMHRKYGPLEDGQIYQMIPPTDASPIRAEKVPAVQWHLERLQEGSR
jgi:hypothetical protein